LASGGKEYELAVKIAGKLESSFNASLGAAGKGLKNLTKTIAAASAAAAIALAGLGLAAINVGSTFEQGMSQVAATMLIDKSTAEGAAAFQTLEDAARECGRSTAFTATEASEALNYLALAGYDAEKAAAALPTVLRLAGAGAMDLASASDMVTDSMAALQIEATESNLTMFADQMAMTASKANTSVAQLGEAILTVGGTAKDMAGGTTELNAALGILADSGMKGSEGGTKLRNMILSLRSPTESASKLMKNLGVEVYDAAGNMRGINEVFGDLNTAMDGMTAEGKDQIMNEIFNKTDLKAAEAMLAGCGERFDELTGYIDASAGACEDMYAIQLDNLNGDLAIMKSGLEDLGITLYQDVNGPLRGTVQLATDMVGQLAAAYAEGGLEGMVGEVGNCLSTVVTKIAEYAPKLIEMAMNLIDSFISGISDSGPAIASAASETIAAFIKGLVKLIPKVLILAVDLILSFAKSMIKQLPEIISAGAQSFAAFAQSIAQRIPEIVRTATELIQTLVSGLISSLPLIIESAIQLVMGLLQGILSMIPVIIQAGIDLILALVQGIMANLGTVISSGTEMILSLIQGIVAMLPTIIQAGVQLIISLIQGIITNLPSIIMSAIDIIMALVQGLISAIPEVIGAAGDIVRALIDALLSVNWLEVGWEIIKSIVGGIWDGACNLVGGVIDGICSLFSGDEEVEIAGLETGASFAAGLEEGTSGAYAAGANGTDYFMEGAGSVDANTAGVVSASQYTSGLLSSTDGITIAGVTAADTYSSSIINNGGGVLGAGTAHADLYSSGILSSQDTVTDAGAQTNQSYLAGLVTDTSQLESAGLLANNAYASGLSTGTDGITTSALTATTTYADGLLQGEAQITEAGNTLTQAFIASMDAGNEGIAAKATEMMASFTQAIESSSQNIGAAMQQMMNGFSTSFEAVNTMSTSVTQAMAKIVAAITSSGRLMVNAMRLTGIQIEKVMGTSWNNVKTRTISSWQSLHSAVVSRARSTASAIKLAFENMTIKIPKPKIPNITVSYSTVAGGGGGTVSIPKFNVIWNAAGGIFDSPTIFNTPYGMQGVGEAGAEAVLPLDTLWGQMTDIISGLLDKRGEEGAVNAALRKLINDGSSSAAGYGDQGERRPIQYAPVYNFHGNAPSKEELHEAEQMSQADFARMMEKHEREKKRREF